MQRVRTIGLTLVVGQCLFLLYSCGSANSGAETHKTASSSNTSSPSLACSYVTTAEAAKLLGGEVSEPTGKDQFDKDGFGVTDCTYKLRTRTGNGEDSLYYNIQTKSGSTKTRQTVEYQYGWHMEEEDPTVPFDMFLWAENSAKVPQKSDVEAIFAKIHAKAEKSCVPTKSCPVSK